MRQHVLDVVGEGPHLLLADDVDRRRGGDRIVVVDELQQRFLDVPRPGLEEGVAAPHPLVPRHVFEHGHDHLAERAERMLSRYSDAPARPRASPCSSVYRAASMSAGG